MDNHYIENQIRKLRKEIGIIDNLFRDLEITRCRIDPRDYAMAVASYESARRALGDEITRYRSMLVGKRWL